MRSFHIAPLALAATLAACSGGAPAGNDATATTGTGTTATAAGDDYPRIKAGLWEMKMTMPGPSGKPIDATMKSCVGEPKPGENPFAPKSGSLACKNEVARAGDGWAVTSECSSDGVTTKTRGTITGDPQSAYKTVMTSVSTGEHVPEYLQKETETVVEAHYIGDCPAGVKPGQMVP